jgi:hypothetical protein
MKSQPAFRAVLALAVLAAFAAPALAGGPLANCESGVPFLWAGGGANIPWNPDQGDLGPLDHGPAVAAVATAFGEWAAVATSTVTYAQGAELPVDVDIDNFDPWLNPVAPDGLSAIVFDDTGEIFDELFGPGSGILGFAGPEWGDVATCTITEGVSFLNGPSFDDAVAAQDVMVHEFGHYTNLAHTAVNGQIFLVGDTSGPEPNNTFGDPAAITVIETMYPFYFGPGSGTASLERDDMVTVSNLYPEPTHFGTTAAVSGTIFASDGTTKLSGVNVIARNVADPFEDAVASVSGDRTDDPSQADPFSGTYRFTGLTPGASYAVFVDQIVAGGFSTPPITLPNAEEFHNAGESNNVTSPDDPAVFTGVSAAAGGEASGVDVIFNSFAPGAPLPVGDDGFVELQLPFAYKVCGQEFDSVFVNANGSLSFGAPNTDFTESVVELLGGLGGTSALLAPPQIAGLWDDLNPSAGGTVSFDQSSHTFSVTWDAVPEFPATGSNSFTISLKRSANHASIEYGDLSATDGLAGLACGSEVTSGFENERDLVRSHSHGHGHHGSHGGNINMNGETAAFEIFTDLDNDLSGADLTFVNFKRGFEDELEGRNGNNTIATGVRIDLPFSTASDRRFTEISPIGGDVDYFRFRARAGDILAIEAVRGSPDTMIGLFDADTGTLLIADDDNGCCGIGGLSRLLVQIPASIPSINLAVAVTSWPDFDFNGTDGVTGGRYVLSVNKYRGTVLAAGDDTSTEVTLTRPFRFQGASWNSVFVNSNGNLTFGAGSTDFSQSVAEFLAGPPRIAPLWDDLNASPGEGLIVVDQSSISTTVHYVSVPQFFDLSGNYFSVTLLPFGVAVVDYGATARGNGIVGVTEGGGAADPGQTDLSDGLPFFSSDGTTYEEFALTSPPEPFDLSFEDLFFAPFF